MSGFLSSEPFIVLGSMYLMPKHLQLNNLQTGAQNCRQSYSQPRFAYRAGSSSEPSSQHLL